MKKFLAVAFAAFALTSFGALEKVGSIRVADVDTLVKGVSRLGEFTGNQMLGIMASQCVGKIPAVDFFGPGRPDMAMSYVLYLDVDNMAQDPRGAFDSISYAVLYPIAQTKAEFLEMHEGAVETNGLVCVCAADDDDEDDGDSCCGECADDVSYVAFTADGKWAAMSDKPEQAKAALEEVKSAERKMDGDLVKIMITPKGWNAIARAIEVAEKEKSLKTADGDKLKDTLAVVRQCSALVGGVRVDERGLDIRGILSAAKGSALTKVGLKPIAEGAWKTAGADAVVVSETAEDSGRNAVMWDDVRSLLKKHGIDTPFLSVAEPAPNYGVFTLDVPAAVEYFKGLSNVVAKINRTKFIEDLTALAKTKESIPLKGPAMGSALAIKGFTPAVDPRTRFETTLPEAKGKPVSARVVFSYYSLFKAVVPVILANVDEEMRMMLEPMLTTLPPEGKSGVAYAVWREKESHRFVARMGADEFKGVSACFAVFSAIKMQQAMKKSKIEAKGKAKAEAKAKAKGKGKAKAKAEAKGKVKGKAEAKAEAERE